MNRRKRVMQSTWREKTWAEKMELKYCRCEHTNTIHAGGIYDCGFIDCPCQEFKERIKSDPPPKSFREVQETMKGTVV